MANKNLAQRVKELRRRKGLSQEELAKKSGLSLRTIQRVENGETESTGETLKRISNAFDLSPEELIVCTTTEDEFKKTVAAKNEYLHIFDNKLIISKANDFNDFVGDYEKFVNNLFKTLLVFVVCIPIFAVLATVFYNTHPDLSFYAGGWSLFFVLMSVYLMLFNSGTSLIYKNQIKSIRLQSSIFGNAIIIKYYDMGRLKRRNIIIEKNRFESVKDILLKEKFFNSLDFKTEKKSPILVVFFIALFITINFQKSFLGIVFLLAFVIFLIIKGVIESYIWERGKITANRE